MTILVNFKIVEKCLQRRRLQNDFVGTN